MSARENTNAGAVSAIGFDAAWLQEFLYRGTGLRFDGAQAAQVAGLAERKLADLFDVAEETALANRREYILLHDLPLTKGLRALLLDVDERAREIDVQPVLAFLAGAGVSSRIDDLVQAEVPRLTAALLLLAGRIIAILEPDNLSPQERMELVLRPAPGEPARWEVERAARVLDLTL
jgi:Domain of unknown function (DUF1931)